MSVSNEPLGHEPSMEEILASIRRILKDDEQVALQQGGRPAGPDGGTPPAEEEQVFVLGPSMMVPEASPQETPDAATDKTPEAGAIGAAASLATEGGREAGEVELPESAAPAATEAPGDSSIEAPAPLIGASAADQAAQHLGALIRTVSANRAVSVSSNGPTLEEIVRNEMRPLLKAWLDANLPSLVERIVRAEIERLIR
jgi:cell pole-organizing protein PopZ